LLFIMARGGSSRSGGGYLHFHRRWLAGLRLA
jgi:hypothetical protein